MSERDSVQPYHAKGAAPGQETADVVAEVLEHARAREQAATQRTVPKGPPRWMLPLSVNIGVLALYFLIAQPRFLEVNPLDDPRPAAEAVASARQAMYMDGITRIDGFLQENGRLPASLDEAHATSLAEQGVHYQVIGGSSYILSLTVGDETIVFDSAQHDAGEFAGAFRIPG